MEFVLVNNTRQEYVDNYSCKIHAAEILIFIIRKNIWDCHDDIQIIHDENFDNRDKESWSNRSDYDAPDYTDITISLVEIGLPLDKSY